MAVGGIGLRKWVLRASRLLSQLQQRKPQLTGDEAGPVLSTRGSK